MIKVYVYPRQEGISWKKFIKTTPKFSIALDGYVGDAPKYNPTTKHLNLNHHEKVDRLSTMSTAKQTYFRLKQGLFESFEENGTPTANIFVNDCDLDVCLSIWLLKNYNLLKTKSQFEKIEELIDIVDKEDVTGGCFKVVLRDTFLEIFAWIAEPYSSFRISRKLYTSTPQEMLNVIKDVEERITLFVKGKYGRKTLDTRYSIIYKNPKWWMIEEIGYDSRWELVNMGMKAFVSAKFIKEDYYVYSLGKLSEFIDFPIEELYEVFNQAENIAEDEDSRWGGSNTIGGSPRDRGSKLTPKEVVILINNYISQKNITNK